MAEIVYKKSGFTGGAATVLDGVDGSLLNDLDMAFVHSTGNISIHLLDADNAGSEDSPDIIAPDTSPGDKRWVRLNFAAPAIKTDRFWFTNMVTDSGTTVSITDDGMVWLLTGTQTGAVTATISADRNVDGNVLFVKDAYDNAGTNNITIYTTGAVGIDDHASYVIDTDGGSVILVYDGTAMTWRKFGF